MPKLSPGLQRFRGAKAPASAKSPGASEDNSVKLSLLTSTLQLAVPLWIDCLRGRDWDYVLQRVRECSRLIAEHGDNVLFRGRKKGESAAAFNALAEGIACLAFAPGGVKVFGEHWESTLVDDRPVRMGEALLSLVRTMETALNAQAQ